MFRLTAKILTLCILLTVAASASAQQDYVSPLNTTVRGTEFGTLPQLRGKVLQVTECTGTFSTGTANGTGMPDHSKDSVCQEFHLDSNQRIISITSAGATCVYLYDKQGRLSATQSLDEFDTTLLESYTYDPQTGLITEIRNHFSDEAARTLYTYSDDGYNKTVYLANSSPAWSYTYFHNQLVGLIGYQTFWAEPDQMLTVTEYDKQGRPLAISDPDDRESSIAIGYDPYGNVTMWVTGVDTVRTEYRYDARQNWTSSVSYENGVPVAWARRTIEYAKKASDFDLQARRYDPYWTRNHFTGFAEVPYPNGDLYVGNLHDGIRHGHGTYYFADGRRYEGQFANDTANGDGSYFEADGTILTGVWHGFDAIGDVTILYANGNRFVGPLHISDTCRYLARTEFPKGGFHEGDYAQGKYDGIGIMRLDDGTRIEGYWEHGKLEGRVTILMRNMDIHHCLYINGQRQAHCLIEFLNGDTYDGDYIAPAGHAADSRYDFLQGQMTGFGTYTRYRGTPKTGYFLNGQYKGSHKPKYLK